KKEQIIKGKVTRISSFGTFVVLKKGVEGLIHVSKIPPGVEFKKDQKIECIIEEINQNARKISLSFLPTEKPMGYK
ncbi:MAG: S1 RNA-binding domain-containing protein, partial [Bacteroidetes bacterium]|nr:S1 RNA-binding domain-containing protein [Bacteroidota bacterium]